MLDFFFARRAITGSRPCTCRVPFVSGGRYRGNSSHIWPTFGRPIPPFRFYLLSICLKSPMLLSAGQSPHPVSISCRIASKAPCSYRQANPPSRFHFLSNCRKNPVSLSAGQPPIPPQFQADMPQKLQVTIGRQFPPFRCCFSSIRLRSPKSLSAGKSPIPLLFHVDTPQKSQVSIGGQIKNTLESVFFYHSST